MPSTISLVHAFCSHLLLTADSLVVLRELSDRAGWARVKHRHQLNSVLKITSKKKHPDIITFKFGDRVWGGRCDHAPAQFRNP